MSSLRTVTVDAALEVYDLVRVIGQALSQTNSNNSMQNIAHQMTLLDLEPDREGNKRNRMEWIELYIYCSYRWNPTLTLFL